MRKYAGLILIAASLISITWIAAIYFKLPFWIKPPVEKLQTTWNADLELLTREKKLPTQWNDIRDINIRSDNSPIQDWIPKIHPQVQTNPKGRYRLEIFLIHWIEGNRYGVVAQMNLVDLLNSNTIWELNRTYKLGIVY